MQLLTAEIALLYGSVAAVHVTINGWPLAAATGLVLTAIATGAALAHALLRAMMHTRLIATPAGGSSRMDPP